MEFSVLRNKVAATSRKRALLRKMKVRNPWGLRSLQTTHERESLPGLEGAKADSRLCHSCKNLPASFPLLLPVLHPPPPLKSTRRTCSSCRRGLLNGAGGVCMEEGSTLNVKSKTLFSEIKSTCLTIRPFKGSCSMGFNSHRVGHPSSQFISRHFHYLKRNPVPLRLSVAITFQPLVPSAPSNH